MMKIIILTNSNGFAQNKVKASVCEPLILKLGIRYVRARNKRDKISLF